MTFLAEKLLTLLADAEDALVERPVGRAELMTGELVWDNCCDGQLYVRLIASAPIPGPGAPRGGPCKVVGWRATIAIGTARCAATMSKQGKAPTPEAITTDTLLLLDDMHDLERVLRCSAEVTEVLEYRTIGPSGACFGGEWMAVVRYPTCDCTPHSSEGFTDG